jgi:uncharacterized protein (TIGR03067 family)
MKPNNTDRDLALLQGVWEQVAHEANGAACVPDEFTDAITKFNGNEYSVVKPDGTLLVRGTIRLDATTIPRQAVLVREAGLDKGRIFPAIYSLSGDTFTVAAANDDRASKPTDFRTDIGQFLRRFVRKRPGSEKTAAE